MQHKDLVFCPKSSIADSKNRNSGVDLKNTEIEDATAQAMRMHDALSALAVELTTMRPTSDMAPFYRIKNLSSGTRAVEIVTLMSRQVMRKRGWADKDIDNVRTWIANARK